MSGICRRINANIMLSTIIKHLPGLNCGNCGFTQCDDFAKNLLEGKVETDNCPVLARSAYQSKKEALEQLLNNFNPAINDSSIVGVIDHYKADIILKPLKGESSCRETLLPFSTAKPSVGNIIQYRPLGCPITHIAKVVEVEHSLITVVLIGPQSTRSRGVEQVIDVGICMVLAFDGSFEGRPIKVGETIRFLPHHCMMQKVHSGVVVNIQNGNVRVEIIDLKVWAMPEKCNSLNFGN